MRDMPHYMTAMPSHRLAFYKILAERSHRLKFISIFIWINNVAGDVLPLRHTNTRSRQSAGDKAHAPSKNGSSRNYEIPAWPLPKAAPTTGAPLTRWRARPAGPAARRRDLEWSPGRSPRW